MSIIHLTTYKANMDRMVGIVKMSLKQPMEVQSKITIQTIFHYQTGLQYIWSSWTNFHKNKQHKITWNQGKTPKSTHHLQNSSKIIKVRGTSRDLTFCCPTKTPKKKTRPKGLTVEQTAQWVTHKIRLRVMKTAMFNIRMAVRCCMFSKMITLEAVIAMITHAKAVLWLIEPASILRWILKLKKILEISILKTMVLMRTNGMMSLLCLRVRLPQGAKYLSLEFRWCKWWIKTLC